MDLSLVQIGFLVIMGIVCLGMSLWLYIDSLKFKLRNMTFDKEMYQRLLRDSERLPRIC